MIIERIRFRLGYQHITIVLYDQRRGRCRRIAMIIPPISQLAIDNGEIILNLACIRVFTLAPLGDVLVVAHTHDRRPGVTTHP
ncbi:hypothetical protein [Thiolapillus sp.]|uniref:hypothetical protein n=1 Tax=Thiolapillus sp. TaxID=2017437 RepID=UPI003AF85DB4